MTLLDALLTRRDPVEGRAITDSSFWGAWRRGDEFLMDGDSSTGVRVNRETALALSTVWACVSLIGDSISTLPVDAYTLNDDGSLKLQPRPGWLDMPNPEQTRVEFIFGVVASLLLDGVAPIYTLRDRKGDVIEAYALDPRWVQIRREPQPDGTLQIVYYVMVAKGMQSPVGPFRVVAGSEMFHINAFQANSSWPRGIPPLEVARLMFGGAIAGQEMGARFFGQGMNASGYIKAPDMTNDQAKQLKADFTQANSGLRKMHLPPVLTGGAEWQPMQINPEQAQFLQQRQFSVEEIARFFRVPPFMIGELQKSTSWGTGIEQQGIGFVRYTLRPWIERLEESWRRHMLIFQPGWKFRFDVDELMRGDAAGRANYYKARFMTASMTPNDIHRAEGEPLQTGDDGDIYYYPVAMAPVGSQPSSVLPTPMADVFPEEPDGGKPANPAPGRGEERDELESRIFDTPDIHVHLNVEAAEPAAAPEVNVTVDARGRTRKTITFLDGREPIIVTEGDEE